jgi:hypothetical protein
MTTLLTTRIDREIRKDLKRVAIDEDSSIQKLVTEAITKLLTDKTGKQYDNDNSRSNGMG